jgi:hypothetical protein
MSLSDLPLPSDISEAQDLEQDLEQALDDEHYPAEDMRRVQSVAGSTESQEEPNPTFSSEEPTALPHFPSTTPHLNQSRRVAVSSDALSSAIISWTLCHVYTDTRIPTSPSTTFLRARAPIDTTNCNRA